MVLPSGGAAGVPTCRRSCLVVKPATCLSVRIVSMVSIRSTAGVRIVFGTENASVSVNDTQSAGLRMKSSVPMRMHGVLIRTGVDANANGRRRRARSRPRTAATRPGACGMWWPDCCLRLPIRAIRGNCNSTWNCTLLGAGVWRFRRRRGLIHRERLFSCYSTLAFASETGVTRHSLGPFVVGLQ